MYIKDIIFFESTNNCYSLPVIGYGYQQTNDKAFAWVSGKTSIEIVCNSTWGTAWTKYVILEYTKTTD